MMKNIFKIMKEMMNMKKMEKMNMKKNEKKMEKMNKGIENLKNLKNLMQIFATFATFAMQIFSVIANIAMQIFHKGSYSAVRVMSVQQPTNFQRISNLSPTVSTVKVGQKSMITRSLPALAMVVMMILGGWNNVVWGQTNNGGTWYSLYDAKEYTNNNTNNIKVPETVIPPTTGTISIDWRKDKTQVVIWYNTGFDLYINGTESSNQIVSSPITSSQDGYTTATSSVGVDITSVDVYYHNSTKGCGHIKNIRIPMAKHIRLENSDAFGITSTTGTVANTVYGSTSATAYHIRLRSFLMQNANLTYHSSNSEFHFGNDKVGRADTTIAVLANSCAFRGVSDATKADCKSVTNALGKAEDYEVDVYFTPSANVNAQRNCTITIKDGNVERATIILTAKVIPTYYFKATSVATDGTSTLDIPVRASFTNDVYSGATMTEGFPATADATSLTKTAYFYAPASQGDYQFQGWYTNAACTSDRVSTDNTISYDIISSATTSGTAVEQKYYAKYLESITAEFENTGSHALDVGDTYEDIDYSRTSSATATDDAKDEENFFWYEIEDNTPTGITTGSDHSDMIISYNPSTKVVTAHNAGTATLILHQRAHGLYEAVDAEYEFTVSKHDPEFTWYSDANTVHFNETIENFCTSNNAVTSITRNSSVENVATISDATLTTYNKAGTTRITMSQEENYYWNEYSEYRDITPVKANNHVPFTYSQALYDLNTFTIAKNQNYWWTDDEPYHLALNEDQDSYVILHFDGIPDKMTFYYKTKGGSISKMYVQESAANDFTEESVKPWSTTTNYTSNWSDLQTIQLLPTTRYVKIFYRGSKLGRIKDISITEKSMQFAVDQTSLNFEIVQKDSEPAARKFTFTHCNAGYRVTATSSDATHYKVSLDAAGPWSESVVIPSTGGDRMGTQDIYVKYYPVDAATHNATITLSDPLGNSSTVNVTGVTQAELATTIEWIGETTTYNVDNDNVPVTDLFRVTYNAGRNVVASPTINLATSDDTKIRIVTVDGVDYLDFLCGGGDDVTITASYAGDGETYEAASDFEKEITVNKLADAIVWDAEADEDGKFHVWADSDIPNTIASANTAIETYASGNSEYLTATQTAGVWTLHAVKQGEVTLTATSAGDCIYATATDTKTIVIDYCYHSINWEQNFVGITTDDNEGNVDKIINLTAYAVDSTGSATGVDITYSVADPTIATIVDGNKLHIIKQGETTITATTAASTKYAVTSLEYDIRVNIPGKNIVSCKNNKDRNDIRNNKIVIDGPHATFTFSGATNITEYYGTDGYALAYDFGEGEKEYSFTWVTTNPNCSIQVKRISFWAKAYNWYAGNASEGKVIFNGEQTKKVGTASLTSTSSDYAHFDLEKDLSSGVTVVCKSEGANFDFYIRNISIEYEVFAITAPTATGETTDVYATASVDDKHLVELDELFSMEDKPTDFAYEYELRSAYDDKAHIYSDNKFYADAAGEYEVRARVAASADHHESDWSTGYVAIRVNRMPNTLSVVGLVDNSGVMELGSTLPVTITATNTLSPIVCEQTSGAGLISYDQATGVVTSGNKLGTGVWHISQAQTEQYLAAESSFTVAITNETIVPSAEDEEKPISDWDTKPTEKDNLTLSTDLTIDEPISVYAIDIAKDAVVTITPTGGLTVGAGGVNIESDEESTGRLILQVKEDDGSKGIEDEIGQTSYILFSPDYDGEMPEAEVQMLSTGYRDMRSGTFDSWQYVGVSIDKDDYAAKDVFAQNAVRSWNESTNKWVNNRKTLMLEPFVGYATQQYNTADGIVVNFDGQLARNRGTHTINLTHNNEGWNLLANSFAAPIDITKFDIGDFGGAEATIYVWDTKNRRYIEVPVGTAKETPGEVASLIIASMQGFFVKTNTATTLTLDYNKLVWGGEQANKPLKVRKNSQDNSLSAKMHIRLTDDNAGMDELTILESANHDKSYENGYDSKKKHSENNGISIYAIENDVQLGFDYTDVIEGTKIGVRTGDSDFYTVTFNNVETDGSLYLYDMHTNIYTQIKEGATYSFYAEPNSYVEGRLEIVEHYESGISTDEAEIEEETNTVKYIKDNTIYILKDGVKYNGMGQRVQ